MKNKIDYKKSKDFWNQRANGYGNMSNESITLFNETNEVKERDNLEKEELLKVLLPENAIALDLGCGIGRLSVELAKRCQKVFAVDFSESLLEIARKENKRNNIYYINSSCIDFKSTIKFDFILISAVLMYIDDKDLPIVIDNLKHVTQKGSLIFLKESVSLLGKNFEIINKYSENLKSEYSAIYRKPIAYSYAFEEAGFEQINLKKLYQHHQETATMIFLFRRK